MGQNARRWFVLANIDTQVFLAAEQVPGLTVIDRLFLTTPQNVVVTSDGTVTLSPIP